MMFVTCFTRLCVTWLIHIEWVIIYICCNRYTHDSLTYESYHKHTTHSHVSSSTSAVLLCNVMQHLDLLYCCCSVLHSWNGAKLHGVSCDSLYINHVCHHLHLLYCCALTYMWVSHVCVTWFIHVCDMTHSYKVSHRLHLLYGVATISRLLKTIGLFCKRAL